MVTTHTRTPAAHNQPQRNRGGNEVQIKEILAIISLYTTSITLKRPPPRDRYKTIPTLSRVRRTKRCGRAIAHTHTHRYRSQGAKTSITFCEIACARAHLNCPRGDRSCAPLLGKCTTHTHTQLYASQSARCLPCVYMCVLIGRTQHSLIYLCAKRSSRTRADLAHTSACARASVRQSRCAEKARRLCVLAIDRFSTQCPAVWIASRNPQSSHLPPLPFTQPIRAVLVCFVFSYSRLWFYSSVFRGLRERTRAERSWQISL